MNTHEPSLNVDFGDRGYPIFIADGLLSECDLLGKYLSGRQVHIVTNETVAPLYLEPLIAGLESFDISHCILPDGESYKNMSSMAAIYDSMMSNRCNRDVTLVALGGGVIGDMTGFAAATYQRGVKFIQIPTTLLAQVDSSVGGKTGINHPLGKNMIGAFYQPQAVLIDTLTLGTLPDREFIAGLAEVIKYGLIGDAEFLNWLSLNMEKLLSRNSAILEYAIRRSCINKAAIVAQDEKEQGIRAILNFGHTFGHAIETATDYKHWLHGEAVGFGMIMALNFSKALGYISEADHNLACSVIQDAGLPQRAPDSIVDQTNSVEKMLSLMALDKKVIDGSLRLVLLRSLGEAFVSSEFDHKLLVDSMSRSIAR